MTVHHFVFITPEPRPFMARFLCDLDGSDEGSRVASSEWARVTCPECLAVGPETVAALLALPDAALVSLGAVAP